MNTYQFNYANTIDRSAKIYWRVDANVSRSSKSRVASTIAGLRFQQAAEDSKAQRLARKKEFILKNYDLFMTVTRDTPPFNELIEKIRQEFKYSPRTVNYDIWTSWRKLAEKIKPQ